jgi:hypothetical protein
VAQHLCRTGIIPCGLWPSGIGSQETCPANSHNHPWSPIWIQGVTNSTGQGAAATWVLEQFNTRPSPYKTRSLCHHLKIQSRDPHKAKGCFALTRDNTLLQILDNPLATSTTTQLCSNTFLIEGTSDAFLLWCFLRVSFTTTLRSNCLHLNHCHVKQGIPC